MSNQPPSPWQHGEGKKKRIMEKIYKGEIQRFLPIFKAMADGETIQTKNGNGWIDIDGDEDGLNLDTLIGYQDCFRIKPEPKYRPFANAEECWKEMLKHQPFGWVKTDSGYEPIWHVNEGDDFNATFKYSTFADGTPFGVKTGE